MSGCEDGGRPDDEAPRERDRPPDECGADQIIASHGQKPSVSGTPARTGSFSARRLGVLEDAGEPFRTLGGARRPSRGDRASDCDQLALDGGTQAVEPSAHEWVQPLDRPIQAPECPGTGVTAGAIVAQRDHVTHASTVATGSDTKTAGRPTRYPYRWLRRPNAGHRCESGSHRRPRTPGIGAPEHLAAGRAEPEPELRALTVTPERLAEDREPRVVRRQTLATRRPRSARVACLEDADLPFGGHSVRIGRKRDHERAVGVCRVDREREAESAREPLGDLVPAGAGVVAAVHAPVELHEEPFGR